MQQSNYLQASTVFTKADFGRFSHLRSIFLLRLSRVGRTSVSTLLSLGDSWILSKSKFTEHIPEQIYGKLKNTIFFPKTVRLPLPRSGSKTPITSPCASIGICPLIPCL